MPWLAAWMMGLMVVAAHAQTFTYDANTGTTNAQDGVGTGWNTSNLNWWNGANDVAWPNTNASVAIFGAGSGAAGTVTVDTVTVNGITFNTTGSGNYTLSGGTITLAGTTPTITTNTSATISSTLAGSSGMIKAGMGTLTLSVANSYTGGTTISAGVLSISNSGALGSGTVVLNGGTLLLNGVNLSNAITLNSTTNTIAAVGNYRVLSGKISGTGGFTLGSGSSTPGVTLTNAGNDFQGNVTISSGNFLRLGASNVLPSTATVNVAGSLRIDGNTTNTIAGLTGSGTVFSTTGSSASTLRIGAGDTTSTFAGAFDGSTNLGPINIEKTGAGTFTLGAANTFNSGTTTVSGGTLALASGGTTGTGAVTVQTGATLLGIGIVRGSSFTAQSGATVQAGATTAQNSYGTLTFTPASGSGSFNFQSGSTVVLGINPGGVGDLLKIDGLSAGTLTFNGNLQVTASGYIPTSVETFKLLDWSNVGTPTFASQYSTLTTRFGNEDDASGFDLPDISGSGYMWDISQFVIDGTINVVAVPEPARVSLLLVGLWAALLRRRRSNTL